MKKLIVVLGVAVVFGLGMLWPAGDARAQVIAPAPGAVAGAEWHTLAKDVEATKKFWAVVGGTPLKIDGTDVMKFPGVLIFIKAGSPPPDGNKGTAVDHPGMSMRAGEALLTKIRAAGYKTEPIGAAEYGPESGYITTPDGLRIEMQGTDNSLSKRPLLGFKGSMNDLPTVSDHLHYFLPGMSAIDAQAWYYKLFGGTELKENNRGNTPSVDIPGIRLRFGGTREAKVTPSAGRAMDYVGFEVKDLKAFCKKIEANGVKLDQPYSKSRHKGFASAELTDPWGLSIELTEGLAKY